MSRLRTHRRVRSSAGVLRILRRELPYLRQRFGVARLALYGSYARSDHGAQSDVDVLVDLSRPLGLEFVSLAYYLEERLGRRVDLATFDAFRRTIEKPHRQDLAASIQEALVYVEAAPG